MWGSYVGAVLTTLIAVFTIPSLTNMLKGVKEGIALMKTFPDYVEVIWTPFRILNDLQLSGSMHTTIPIFLILEIIFYIMIGFLLGWGIHSLVRAVRR